jgi:phage N-6-adenine-methyltransferase
MTVVSLRKTVDRICADVPAPEGLDARIASMRERNLRMVELESQKAHIKKVLLVEVLELAAELQKTVALWFTEHGKANVAEVARQTGIRERDAERLFKLPVAELRQEIATGEAQFGAEYVYPSWRTRVPGYKPATALDVDDTAQDGTPRIGPGAPTGAAVEVRLLEIGRQIVAEFMKGRKANQELLLALEQEQADLRRSTATSPPAGEMVPKYDFDKLRAELHARNKENAELRARLKRSRYGMYGRGDPEQETPPWLYDHFDREFHFTCDAAASATNHKHPNYFDKQRDGLAQEWQGVIWLNPPYNDIERWLQKVWKSAQNGCTVVVLIPLWTNMDWFQTIAIHAHIRLLSLRPSFAGHKGKPSFDFMALVFTKESKYRDGRLHVTIEHLDDPTKKRRNKKRVAQED